VHDTTMKV